MGHARFLPFCTLTLLLGCAQPGPKVAIANKPQEAAPGMEVVSSKDGTFTVPIPNGWVKADKSVPAVKRLIDKNPKSPAAQMITSLQSTDMIQLIAIDLQAAETRSSFVSNLNVVVLPAPDVPADFDMEVAAKQASAGMIPKGAKTGTITTPYGKAGKYWGSTKIGSNVDHDLMGAILIHDKKQYVFSMSTAAGLVQALSEVFDKMVAGTKFN